MKKITQMFVNGGISIFISMIIEFIAFYGWGFDIVQAIMFSSTQALLIWILLNQIVREEK